MSESLSQSTPGFMSNMRDIFETYQEILQQYISATTLDLRFQKFRRLAEVRSQYEEALEQLKYSHVVRIRRYLAYSRYLLQVEKTIAGLIQLALQHTVRKSATTLPPLSLSRRVRLLTVTHPAIAPPQFV